MEKINHAEKAKSLFESGYNCCQAVLCAYADELGLDETTALKIASSFGGGMGRLREVCGAVSGMFMVCGLRDGYTNIDGVNAHEEKMSHYERIQELARKFINENGSIICRELLGLAPKKSSLDMDSPVPEKRSDEYYKKRPCAELVAMAASFLEKEL
ncbi:MAG: C_GCAxxG_C_C family protein [Spirochaetaceae bacterium]|nr:C_GCAxxG_C_C family protein [Spirochaetaceae bacterium]